MSDDASASSARRSSSSYWKVWKCVRSLTNKESSLFSVEHEHRYDELANETVHVLTNWAASASGAGADEWRSFLNKPSLLHEVEESLVAVQFLLEWLDNERRRRDRASPHHHHQHQQPHVRDVTVLDVCCGKGVFSMLLSFLAGRPAYRERLGRIARCVMIDKADVCWRHVDAAATMALDASESGNGDERRVPVEMWPGCDVHSDSFPERLRDEIASSSSSSSLCRMAVVGIHLCKTLSPRLVGVFNTMEAETAPFLLLAPCCLPRLSRAPNARISVPLYCDRRAREEYDRIAKLRRDRRRRRRPATDDDKNDDTTASPCWRCGRPGHLMATCTAAENGPPPLPKLPTAEINVDEVRTSSSPFDVYCRRLAATVEPRNARSVMLRLDSSRRGHGRGDESASNWNASRKSTWIVSERYAVDLPRPNRDETNEKENDVP